MYKSIDELKNEIENNSQVTVNVKAIPNAKKSSIDFCDDFIKIKVTARAVEGKANKAIIEFLSQELKIAKSNFKMLRGEKSSIKVIRIERE